MYDTRSVIGTGKAEEIHTNSDDVRHIWTEQTNHQNHISPGKTRLVKLPQSLVLSWTLHWVSFVPDTQKRNL